MRGAAAGLLLALAAAGCARPGDLLAAAPDGDRPPERPTLVTCAAVLGVTGNAIQAGWLRGDMAAVRAGLEAYRRKAAEAMGDVESRQAIGSSFAFYDNLTPAQLAAASGMCLEAVDREFAERDWW